MENIESFFSKIEKYKAPSTILFRSIELKLLKRKFAFLFCAKRVLDLGCGEGIAASTVFDKKVDYGLDSDPIAVKQAKESGVYKKVILANARKIPLANNSLDLVFCNCVIEHIKDLDSVLNEVKRILKKEGYFIFTAPSNNFKNYSIFSYLKLRWLAKIYGRLRDQKYHHYHCYSLKEWANILEKKGFKLLDGYYYFDKRTTEFWDFLLIIFYLFSEGRQKFSSFVFKNFFRKRIYQRFIDASMSDPTGAAVCVVTQKR